MLLTRKRVAERGSRPSRLFESDNGPPRGHLGESTRDLDGLSASMGAAACWPLTKASIPGQARRDGRLRTAGQPGPPPGDLNRHLPAVGISPKPVPGSPPTGEGRVSAQGAVLAPGTDHRNHHRVRCPSRHSRSGRDRPTPIRTPPNHPPTLSASGSGSRLCGGGRAGLRGLPRRGPGWTWLMWRSDPPRCGPGARTGSCLRAGSSSVTWCGRPGGPRWSGQRPCRSG